MENKLLHANITEKILESYYTINKSIAYGIPTDIYKNAIALEFKHNNLTVQRYFPISIIYRDNKIGDLTADFIIENKVIVQIVNEESINKRIEDEIKLLLRYSKFEICLILNPKGESEYKRIIFTNDFKKNL